MNNEYTNEKIVHVELDEKLVNQVNEFPDVNLIREKTFNLELDNLVGKILRNEEKGRNSDEIDLELSDPPFVDQTVPTAEELLLEIEKQIYELKNSEFGIVNSYNPFQKFIDVDDDINDIETYLNIAMEQAGFSSYSLLKYSIGDGAFRIDFSTFEDDLNENISLSVKDNIFERITSSKYGFRLQQNDILADVFLLKQFTMNIGTYYFIKASKIYDEMEKMGCDKIELTDFSEFLSPILLIKLNDSSDLNDEEIFREIVNFAVMPISLYLIQNRMYMDLQNYSYESTLKLINSFVKLFVKNDLYCIILTLKDYSVKENLFLFKYLLSKIKNILISNSLIFRTSIDKAIILPRNGEEKVILKCIDEFKQTNEEIVDFEILTEAEKFQNFDTIKFFI